MAKDRDDQLNQDEFSLEAILAEFGSGSEERQGQEQETPAAGSDARTEPPEQDELAQQDWFPTHPHEEPPPQEPPGRSWGAF